ncbi:MAG: transglutaminase-like cysteine peptidase [Alphaproteobacteria bacterium]|nr:transglutaminase-like cysteine peptidase [Alphaproteobacteria bacterium]MDE2110385.1 transglutaminase-like cysteine peptidase [Alphaproteobacteria bacterium]MDE2495278.1 transglutaminase-like cysteine peptidase [Alphaproteobacteria bacterium]
MRTRWMALVLIGGLASFLGACQSVPGVSHPLALDTISPAAPAPLPAITTPMPIGIAQRDPPPGFVSFCMRYENQCSSAPSEASVVQLTPAVWSELRAVNTRVNEAIWPEDDKLHFDRAEFWTIPTDGYGNCHDYMLTKRELLAAAGLPLRALRMAVVVTGQNERHAVLTVATNYGDYVLDNLTDDIVPWNQTGYQWISRQDSKNDWGWVALDGQPTQLAAATGTTSAN